MARASVGGGAAGKAAKSHATAAKTGKPSKVVKTPAGRSSRAPEGPGKGSSRARKAGPVRVAVLGGELVVDAVDAAAVEVRKWYPHPMGSGRDEAGRPKARRGLPLVYWGTPGKDGRPVFLGELVCGLQGKEVGEKQAVLHRNGDLADGRRKNLVVIGLGTAMHRREVPKRGGVGESQYIGVNAIVKDGEATGRWVSKIVLGGVSQHLGTFASEEEAAEAYDRAAAQAHGEWARLNWPEE